MDPHSNSQGTQSDSTTTASTMSRSGNETISFPAFNPAASSGSSSSRSGAAARVEKQRNRRGSLRRSAILGGGEGRMRELERRGLGERALVEMGLLPGDVAETRSGEGGEQEEQTGAPTTQYQGTQAQVEPITHIIPSSLTDATIRTTSTTSRSPMESLRLDTTSAELSRQISPPSSLASPLTSPQYGSTTDDDDGLHLKVNRSISAALSHPDPAAAMADLHRRLNARIPTPLSADKDHVNTSSTLSTPLTSLTTASSMATTAVSSSIAPPSANTALTAVSPSTTSSSLTPSSSTAPALPTTTATSLGHDYAATERWGYTILIFTWLVFVIGMGSCFDLWSWAWDVGQTPYAPPELEDDDSLPIVGYYPALMALAGVMAWIWVTIAWVGMKSFRHAKVLDLEE